MKKKIKLIPDWKQSWKFSSIRFSALGAVVMSIMEGVHQGWIAMPSEVSQRVPNAAVIALVIYILVMLGRIYRLTAGTEDDDEDSK